MRLLLLVAQLKGALRRGWVSALEASVRRSSLRAHCSPALHGTLRAQPWSSLLGAAAEGVELFCVRLCSPTRTKAGLGRWVARKLRFERGLLDLKLELLALELVDDLRLGVELDADVRCGWRKRVRSGVVKPCDTSRLTPPVAPPADSSSRSIAESGSLSFTWSSGRVVRGVGTSAIWATALTHRRLGM